jgi:hypothetical protein
MFLLLFFGSCYRGKKLLAGKTAHGAPSKPQHATKKNTEKALTMLPCLTGLYAAITPISKTMRTLPTKLAGNLPHIPIVTRIKAIWEIFILS